MTSPHTGTSPSRLPRPRKLLEILGLPSEGEPGFYDRLRGLALHRAGDHDGAADGFQRYFTRWPGDIIGRVKTERLAGELRS
jgi:hypothetical protein